MAATNQQVQNYVDQRVRPLCEAIRAVYLAAKDDKSAFDDIYANLTGGSPWADGRNDGPPHLLTASDVLAWNTFISDFIAFVEGTLNSGNMNEAAGQYAIILKSCGRGVTV